VAAVVAAAAAAVPAADFLFQAVHPR